jgi:hypothetical protein
MFLDGLYPIGRAGRRIAAILAKQRAQYKLVELNQPDKNPATHVLHTF